MRQGLSVFNMTSIALGLTFLYLPIVILVIYSFNASRLVTVWGGWSIRWYEELLRDEGMRDAAWATLRIGFVSATFATVLGTLAVALVRLGRFRGRALFSNGLRAAGHARGHNRAVAVAPVRGGGRRSWLDHQTRTRPYHVLRHGRCRPACSISTSA
jgi:hypothetical protein